MFFDLSVFRDRSRLSTSGESCSHGFRLDITHRRLSMNAKTRFKKFRKEPFLRWDILPRLAGYFLGIDIWTRLFMYLYTGPRPLPLLGFLSFEAGCLGAGLLTSAAMSFLPRKSMWQWHACEHKAILMLRQGVEPTMENLRKMPPSTPSCGSAHIFLWAATPMAFSLLAVFPLGARIAVTILVAAAWCQLCLVSVGQKSWDPVTRLIYLIGLPGTLAAVTYERLFVLRTPTEEQLKRTLRFMRFMYRRHPWLASPKLRRSPVFKEFIAHRKRTTAHP